MSLDEAFAKLISEREARVLRPAASQIASAVKEYQFLQLYVAPTVDAAIAAAIASNVFKRNGVNFALKFAIEPPKTLEKPSLLIGYPSSAAEEIKAAKPSSLIGYGEFTSRIAYVQVASTNDSSVAALTAAVLSEVTIVGPISVYSIASGYWRGFDRGKRGEFEGFEKTVLELLKLENRVEEHFTIRLFRWNREPTERALALTLDPYLPGITGKEDKAEKLLLEDPRLAPLKGKTVYEASEQALTVLGEKLYELIKSESRVQRRASEIIGLVHYYPKSLLSDLREAALAFAAMSERVSAVTLAMLGVAESMVVASAAYNYLLLFDSIVSYIDGLLEGSLKLEKKRIGKIDAVVLPSTPPSILIVDRLARKLGLYEAERVPVYEREGRYYTVYELLLYRLGYNRVIELLQQRCISVERSDGFIVGISQGC